MTYSADTYHAGQVEDVVQVAQNYNTAMSDTQLGLFEPENRPVPPSVEDVLLRESTDAGYAATTPAINSERVEDDPWAEDETESNEIRLGRLAEQACVCTACGLAQSRNKVVFGEGNPASPLVFVGEGPGQQEDASGRPFVGRAGALLDECLRECGMNRKHVYICNILKCRACLMENGRVQNRPPRIDEVDACSRWLDEQLRILNPLVIVCLGGPSANHLIHRNFRIMAERGQWFTSCRYARYAIAALHPAFILRQEGPAYESSRRLLIDDIESARRKVIEAKKEPPVSLF